MNKHYPNLFSPIRVGNVTLKNRVVMSAMDTCYTALDGTLTEQQAAHYLERAKGGVGMIVTEVAPIDWPGGKTSRREVRFNNTEVTCEWAGLVQRVHSFGTKILAQLSHGGIIASPDFSGGKDTLISFAPEDMSKMSTSEALPARTISREEIYHMFDMVRECCINIDSCGFDGVEFHAGHDYLYNSFISPYVNKRTDEFGGSTENRARFLTESVKIAREVLGPNKIVSVRLAVFEEVDGGIDHEEGLKLAKLCEEAGANLIDCTIGYAPDGQATEAEWLPDGRRVPNAAYIKPHMTTAKVGVVGKLRTPDVCEEAIASGATDLVFLARQMLCDPHWAKKAEMGRACEIRECLSCREGCFAAFRPKSGSIRCVLNPYTGFEHISTEHNVAPAYKSKKILIVGGGIAGMQAAIIAKKRGHEVILAEKTGKLGGQMQLAGLPPHKQTILKAMEWFAAEVERVGITPQLNTTVDDAYIEEVKPDVVLLAIGSEPSRPPVEGIETAADGWDVLRDIDNLPENKEIVIIGGGTVGCEIAHTLIEKNNHISIVEMMSGLSMNQNMVHRQHNQKVLDDANTNICLNARVQKVEANKVTYLSSEGEVKTIDCDMVICATGQRPKDVEWASNLRSEGIEAYTLGDATATGNFQTATRSAMDVVMAL